MPRGRRPFAFASTIVLWSALVCAAPVASSAPTATAAIGAPASRATSDAGAVDWSWPVPPPIRVLEPFRAPATPYSAGHRGVDLAAVPGADVVAAAAGVVQFAGWVGDRFLVAIDHGDGVISSIEPVEPSVAAGTRVGRGMPIGRVSAGGHCAPGCAHFGVRIDGVYVSPFVLLGGLPRAVLLPLR
jgi:murein DD-endopeptidase MepM/ murein hydrolase activator NlpD